MFYVWLSIGIVIIYKESFKLPNPDTGSLDPDSDPNGHQNLIDFSSGHTFQKSNPFIVFQVI